MAASSQAPVVSPFAQCQSCHALADTKLVTLSQNIGMFMLRKRRQVTGHLCQRCIRAYYRSYSLNTLFLGWWGVISFCMTPFILAMNTWEVAKSFHMQPPQDPAITAQPVRVPQDMTLTVRVLYGVVVFAFVLVAIFSNAR